ncbi:xanthine dehydrogenase small subunit [Exilibacterium tricleocarpae]|uniref:xanthine dehydrogenase small subunit n=1 Tax=Exilibacterium tricleocarpae TaxID=2591008 RepID=UPI0015D436B5|nr:xanthine dehydrogenase small subunit [Exilibacterium tricleocarpae]
MIEFLFNGEPVTESNLDPDLTILRYLRTKKGSMGTKEGCASGDCGACTVLVGERLAPAADRGIDYRAVNACIALVGSLHGKHLVTVEGLAGPDDALHPVQRAMVDNHASQCGFCTPGIVMSLAALHESAADNNVDNVLEALSGNLCRCTGYRPIIDAGLKSRTYAGAGNGLGIGTGVDDSLDNTSPNVPGKPPGSDFSNTSSSVPDLAPDSGFEKTPGSVLDTAVSSVLHKTANGAGPDNAFVKAQSHWPEIGDRQAPALVSPLGRCVYPRSERELKHCIEAMPAARFIAGGTDLLLEVTQSYRRLPQLIGLADVAELKTHSVTDNVISLGGALSYTDVCAVLREPLPEVVALLHRFGSRQIRNRGTLGGNLANASPIGDMPPLLLALDAELELSTVTARRRVAVADFYLDYKKTLLQPGEYIRRIIIPRPAAGDFFKCYKVSKRFEDDISAVMLALRWRLQQGVITEVCLAYGGMAAIPKRAAGAEAVLLGQPLEAAAIEQAAAALAGDFSPLSDVRASSQYRLRVAGRLLHKAFLACRAPGVAIDRLDDRQYQSPARSATQSWPS